MKQTYEYEIKTINSTNDNKIIQPCGNTNCNEEIKRNNCRK